MKKFTLGLIAEYITIIIYKLQFYQILYHRKRYYVGEIDIIALRGQQLIFIEVKARNSLDYRVLSPQQQVRIKKSVNIFLYSNPKYQNYCIRFDLVIIRPYSLPIIIKNAW
ncbi:YraN family protein [Candidatus Tisiphia endosymbiont of Nemotelus uliginosus]|uniref:YraN family protein n=1 Tax=Candidatus Tisiphia endosymbiont of Nemotelus uliginosus TaxID=3077926 RepID=UPI0035C893BD